MYIFLLLIAHGLDTQNCVTITCDTSLKTKCMTMSKQLISFNPCSTNYTCPNIANIFSEAGSYSTIVCEPDTTSSNISCGENWGPGNNPSGWYCCINSNCLSGMCQNNICNGKAIGANCANDGECEAYSFCNSTCTSLLQNGNYCENDSPCPVGSGCNNQQCTSLFSLNIKNNTQDKKFCISNFEKFGICDYLFIMQSGVMLYPPYQCNIGNNCDYYLFSNPSNIYISSPCYCSGIPGSTGFCSMPDGMSEADLTYRITYTSTTCSGNLAHTTDPDYLFICGSIINFDQQFYKQVSAQRKYWPLFQSQALLACVTNDTLFNPYDYGMSASESLRLSAMVLIILNT